MYESINDGYASFSLFYKEGMTKEKLEAITETSEGKASNRKPIAASSSI